MDSCKIYFPITYTFDINNQKNAVAKVSFSTPKQN